MQSEVRLKQDLIKDEKRVEFDFSEFAFAIIEVFGLLIVAMIEPGPATLMELWSCTIHIYTMVNTPLGMVIQQYSVVVRGYAAPRAQAAKARLSMRRSNN